MALMRLQWSEQWAAVASGGCGREERAELQNIKQKIVGTKPLNQILPQEKQVNCDNLMAVAGVGGRKKAELQNVNSNISNQILPKEKVNTYIK